MKKIIPLLAILQLFVCCSFAQTYFEPIIGYQVDLNNHQKFRQINSVLQLGLKQNRHFEFLFQLQKSWPNKVSGNDSSFTLNTTLPLYANAPKTIKASSMAVTTGVRISLLGLKTSNIFSFVVYTGLNYQHFAVKREYDKNNYILLNADKTLNTAGFFVSGGVEYLRLLKNGRLFFQLIAATPPARKNNYPSSFVFMAPLSFNAGYSLPIKKNKHEKK